MGSKYNILGVNISHGSYDQIIQHTITLSEKGKSSMVCFANAHMIVEANKETDFCRRLNEADIVAPDGKPISLLMNALYKAGQERVCGMDFMPKLMHVAEKQRKTILLYGSTEETLELIKQRASIDFPELIITDAISPPFRTLTDTEDQKMVDRINGSNPDYIFVSLGCPKQENWIYDHMDKLNACMLGLGQAFLVYSGQEKRLPKWMRNLSLEWAYRLYLEPKRLWKRYLVYNSKFIILAFKHLINSRLIIKSS